eukprot:scaffold412_cov116-Isochrysis_galbana.AAC.8
MIPPIVSLSESSAGRTASARPSSSRHGGPAAATAWRTGSAPRAARISGYCAGSPIALHVGDSYRPKL